MRTSGPWSLPRRSFLTGAATLCGCAVAGVSARAGARRGQPGAGAEELKLSSLPRRVFKAFDPDKQRTESCFLNLVPELPQPGAWGSTRLELALRCGPTVISRHTYEAPALSSMRIERPPPQSGAVSVAPYLPFIVRIRACAPVSAAMDAIDCTLHLTDPTGRPHTARAAIPFGATYEQKTALIFPFRGRGVITQGGIHNGGHSNRSGQFAVDAIGLTPMYAPQLNDDEVNDAAAGWGREIIAPAAGLVVLVRGDRPDQPVTGKADPEFMLPQFRAGGDPGNHLVIDHGNGEFSMLAHFRAGSIIVQEGQRIARAEPLGQLGNSGDSNFPHVHYQLMDGQDWTDCDALPYRFDNMPASLTRGTCSMPRCEWVDRRGNWPGVRVHCVA